MGLYIRKAIRVGPFRFNLSKSGIGVSAGIKGLRVGSGPRGNYVHMGRGGLYFRQTLGRGARLEQSRIPEPPAPVPGASAGPFHEIETSSIAELTDSSSAAILEELNDKKRKLRLLPFVIIGGGALLWWEFSQATDIWLLVASTAVVLAACWMMAQHDAARKTTVIMYDLESEVVSAFEGIHDALRDLNNSGRVWHVEAKADVQDPKYHAGAGGIIKRQSVALRVGQPPLVKTNLDIPLLPAGRQVLAFMPDRLLVFESNGVGAVSYSDLLLHHSETRFIESDAVPSDATVIDKTWRYVNKKGGPDKRFKDNRELPVCAYSQLQFSSGSGLNEMFHASKRGAGPVQARALAAIRVLFEGEISK